MRALLILITLFVGSHVMAKEGGGILGRAIGGVPMTAGKESPPNGEFDNNPPNKSEMFLLMWRQSAGFKPIPEDLMKKYNLPPDVNKHAD
jgi:hypothetical protein